jgi:hypothetical protein
MEATLDREPSEAGVRRILEDFNARVIDARRQLTGGPPVVTPVRDVEEEVRAWRARRRAMGLPVPPSDAERAAQERARAERDDAAGGRGGGRRRWWRRS